MNIAQDTKLIYSTGYRADINIAQDTELIFSTGYGSNIYHKIQS